ncbi:hypothetical protein [Pseudomonas phage D6]|nr:hypothetical protein [Pseudomonas phage D6]
MLPKPESWLKKNLPMIAVVVGSVLMMGRLSYQIADLEGRLNNSTEWLLDEVIAVGDEIKDIRDELDNT